MIVSRLHNGLGGRRGFTFAEALAAMIFLAIVLPVTVQSVLTANRLATLSIRGRTAALIADAKLSEAIMSGEWESGNLSDSEEENWPDYRWEIESSTWEEDGLNLVTIEVFYTVQGKEYSVKVSTLAADTEEEEEETVE